MGKRDFAVAQDGSGLTLSGGRAGREDDLIGLTKGKKTCFSEDLTVQQRIELDAWTQCGECLKFFPVRDVTGRP